MNTFKSFEEYEQLLSKNIDDYNKYIKDNNFRGAEFVYSFHIEPNFVKYKQCIWRGDLANNCSFHYCKGYSQTTAIYISMEFQLIQFKKLH